VANPFIEGFPTALPRDGSDPLNPLTRQVGLSARRLLLPDRPPPWLDYDLVNLLERMADNWRLRLFAADGETSAAVFRAVKELTRINCDTSVSLDAPPPFLKRVVRECAFVFAPELARRMRKVQHPLRQPDGMRSFREAVLRFAVQGNPFDPDEYLRLVAE